MFRKIRFSVHKTKAAFAFMVIATSHLPAQQWENVGGSEIVSAAGGSNNNLAVRRNRYFISYYDTSVGKGSVQVFDGNTWSYAGGNAGITNGTALYNSLSADHTGNLYYTNQIGWPGAGMEVRKFNGTSWIQLPDAADVSINYHASAVSASNVLYTFSGQNSGTVRRYANGAWEQVGNTGFSGGAAFAEMVIGSNNKVYTCSAGSGSVKVYENTSSATPSDQWTLTGGSMVDAASSGEQYTSDMAIDAADHLYVAYVSHSASGQKLNVKKFNGTGWVPLGNANFSSGKVQHVAIAVTASGTPYVVASRWENDDLLRNTVYSLDPATQTWKAFGGDFISDGQATYNDLAVDQAQNYLVLAYSQNGIRVKRISLTPACSNTDPGNNPGDVSCTKFMYGGQTVYYTTVRGADGKIWLQQNLGSSRVAASLDDTESYGDLFQWGRWDDGHQLRSSSTTAAPAVNSPEGITGPGMFIMGSGSASWWSSNATSDGWNAASVSGVTSAIGVDPCKAIGPGWKLPSQNDWAIAVTAEGINNPASAYNSRLKLPAAGYRSNTNGGFTYVGARGYYWSSDTANSGGKYLYIGSTIANAGSGAPRGQGESVRCIKEATGLSTSENHLIIKPAAVYPNPTHGAVHIKADASIESVSVFNSLGQKIPVPFSGDQIDLQGASNGVYIIKVKLKNGQIMSEKIMKN